MSKIIRKRYDAEKMRQLVAGFEGSGITQKNYCQQHDVPLWVFQYWRKKLTGVHQQDNVGFYAVEPSVNPFQVELIYPNGVCVSSRQGFDAATLHSLIKLW